MKNILRMITLASFALTIHTLIAAPAKTNNVPTPTATTATPQVTPASEQYLEAMLMMPILKQSSANARVRYNNKTVSIFCNVPELATLSKGLVGSLLVLTFGLIASIGCNEKWGYTASGSTDYRGRICVAITGACVLLGAASAYASYRIFKDMMLKFKARSNSTPILTFSPSGIAIWGEELASWNTIGSLEAYKQIEGLSGMLEPVPTLCIYDTTHQCLMMLPQDILPLPAAQIIELASTYKSIYQTTTPAAR